MLNRFALLVAAVVLFSTLAAPPSLAQNAATIEARATGLRNTNGVAPFCLWREEETEGFQRCDRVRPLQAEAAPASAPVVRYQSVTPGAYAVSFFHDEQKTGRPRTNMAGMPTTAVGDNRAVSFISPPSFDRSRFAVSGPSYLRSTRNSRSGIEYSESLKP